MFSSVAQSFYTNLWQSHAEEEPGPAPTKVMLLPSYVRVQAQVSRADVTPNKRDCRAFCPALRKPGHPVSRKMRRVQHWQLHLEHVAAHLALIFLSMILVQCPIRNPGPKYRWFGQCRSSSWCIVIRCCPSLAYDGMPSATKLAFGESVVGHSGV